MGSASPVVWMIDALQGQCGAPPQDPQGTSQGGQLAGVRQGAPAARQPDGVGDAGGLGGLASAQDGPAGPAAAVCGPGDRDRAPAAPGLRPWRQTEGLLRSLATLLGVGIGIPDHTPPSPGAAPVW